MRLTVLKNILAGFLIDKLDVLADHSPHPLKAKTKREKRQVAMAGVLVGWEGWNQL
jgi:hypothetical protein